MSSDQENYEYDQLILSEHMTEPDNAAEIAPAFHQTVEALCDFFARVHDLPDAYDSQAIRTEIASLLSQPMVYAYAKGIESNWEPGDNFDPEIYIEQFQKTEQAS